MQLRFVSAGLLASLAAFSCSSGAEPKASSLLTAGSGSSSGSSGGSTTDGAQVTTDSRFTTPVSDATSELDIEIGGTVSGLTGTVALSLVAGTDSSQVSVSANGAFTFPKTVHLGASFTVSVHTQPTGQLCAVKNGTGTTGAGGPNISVTCTPAFSVGGHVVGSTGNLVLSNNDGAPLGVTGNGLFTFQELVAAGTAFAVKVVTPPQGQGCAITTHAAGTITATVSDVAVECFTPYPSCSAMHLAMPAAPTGVYPIAPSGSPFNAYCDMTRDGGGWMRAVNVRPDTSFQGDTVDALGDVSETNRPAKLDDATITSLSTVGYIRFDCGSLSAFVKNDSGGWTSARTNGLGWTLDPTRTGNFTCAASDDGYVFSTATGATDACGAAGMAYVAAHLGLEGAGCYAEGAGWYQSGALWVK